MHLIVDAHEDLAWNMESFGRDYTRPAAETRRLEAGRLPPTVNGDTLLGYPDYQRGRVGIVFATLFASPMRSKLGEWDTQTYETIQRARELYSTQLDVYHRLVDEHADKFRLLLTAADLESHLAAWKQPPDENEAQQPVGLVILMEGAEGVTRVEELEEWWQRGVRLIGPAWQGNRFCGGTREPGPLTAEGIELLEAMGELGFTLDLSHMDRASALPALERYEGAVIASHANALRLVKGSDSNRHLTDEVIEGIIARDGVIGAVTYNNFLVHGWSEDGHVPVPLEAVAAQIDYVCQKAGDARHAAIGSDFDGGFGLQQVPAGIETVADLQKLAPLLEARGYKDAEVAAILGGNWIECLKRTLRNG